MRDDGRGMMHYGWNDGGWGIVWMIVSWSVIVALLWFAFRAVTRDDKRRELPRTAKDVLAERFAKGEIDADEYHERLRVLEEPPHT
jgi:putative membrane protein